MSQHGYPERLSNRSKSFQEDGPSQPTMEVLVETLTGTAFEMTVSPSDTIFAIKSKIFRVEGIPVSQQHLVYNLRELADGASLREHGVAAGARLRLVLALRGGPVTARRPPPPDRPPPDREEMEWAEAADWSGCSSGSSCGGGVTSVGSVNGTTGGAGGSEGGAGGATSGCKVTVLVFREGKRVNMLRVRENRDGTYSPLDQAKGPTTLTQLLQRETGGSHHENAVTMGKMIELRRRMEALELRRRRPLATTATAGAVDKPEIQKTRSEETLSVSSLLDEPSRQAYDPFVDDDAAYDRYDRYDRYGCYGRADTCALLPPIGTRALSNHSLQDTVMDDRFKLPEAVATTDEGETSTTSATQATATSYGALGGETGGWRSRGFGSSSQLGGGAGGGRGGGGGVPRPPRPLHAPPLSASTSDLEQLTRNRMLPALSRHRNREHLHLSDERLELRELRGGAEEGAVSVGVGVGVGVGLAGGVGEGAGRRVRCGLCRRRLSAATEHRCRCGAAYCAPHRYAEVHGCLYDYKAPHHQRP